MVITTHIWKNYVIQGILSDDGDSIVDKYGQISRKLDCHINEDTYDESGFRLVTHSVLEKDLGTVMSDISKKKDVKENQFIFDNPMSETIFKVFSTICERIDNDKSLWTDMVHRVTTDMYAPPFLMSEKNMRNALKQQRKKINQFKVIKIIQMRL